MQLYYTSAAKKGGNPEINQNIFFIRPRCYLNDSLTIEWLKNNSLLANTDPQQYVR